MTVFSLNTSPVAKAFYEDRHRHSMIMGPFGSGKTVATIQKIIRLASEQEPNEDNVRRTRWAVVRETYKQLEDTVIRSWLDWFPPPVWGAFYKQASNYEMRWALEDGSIVSCDVWFRGLDRPDQVANLLGGEYTGAWFNESRYTAYEIFDAMDGRINRYPPRKDGVKPTWVGIMMDTNPPDEDHWLYKLFEERKPRNAKAFYQPSGLSDEKENKEFLDENYYIDLAEGKDDYFVNVYVHGHYGYLREGKPVYPSYNDHIHCLTDLEVIPGPLFMGLDFGLTPACVICQKAANGQLRVIDEVTSDRAGIKQFLEVVVPYLASTYPENLVEAWYADPAGGFGSQTDMKTPFDVMMDFGIYPIEGEQSPEIRIESVINLTNKMIDGNPAIIISHKCVKLRKGFAGAYHYRRMKVSKETYADKPDKSDPTSHIHDALQYLVTRMYGVSQMNRKVVKPRVVGKMS